MITPDIESYIIKYLTKTATEKEIILLENWAKNPTNKKLLSNYVLMHHSINSHLIKNNTQPFKNNLSNKIRQNNTPSYRLNPYSFIKYAAILLLFICSSFLVFQNIFKQTEHSIEDKNQITLELDNGTIQIINTNENKKIINHAGSQVGFQNGDKLNYNSKNTKDYKLAFNKLSVPYGKMFELILSDGTKIKLNAGTSIKYPVQFMPNQPREIVINGEAYFDVTKDSKNPFIVNANNLKVRVIGTEFNLSAYPEEQEISTVLVEGLVGLYDDETYTKETATLLKPGFKAVYNQADKAIYKEKVDTSLYTSWRTGRFIFRNSSFKNIVRRLERNYDVVIVNNNAELGEQYFSASFDIEEEITHILNTFSKSYTFSYVLNNNQIIIN